MERLTQKFSILPIALGLLVAIPALANASQGELRISGKVLSATGEPVIGATVMLKLGETIVSGAVGDVEGLFIIRVNMVHIIAEIITLDSSGQLIQAQKLWTLKASSIGYKSSHIELESLSTDELLNSESVTPAHIAELVMVLQAEQVLVEGVTVIAEAAGTPTFSKQIVTNVDDQAQRGFSVTNPIEAVRAPEVSRSGSAFSSQIRFSGSNPDYTLNGASIGRDPAHYGMFSVLPSVAISEVGFSDQALEAKQALPGQVELKTDRSFKERAAGELTLSALEAVGGYQKGTDRWFVNAALRKSVLDKIIEHLDVKSDRRTIPPTNFQDVFISSGVKLSAATSLFLDQYHAQDFLAFNSAATAQNSAGIAAFQHTRNRMFAAHLRHITPSLLINLKTSAKFDKAIYSANAADADNPLALQLDLRDNTTTLRSDADIAFSIGDNQITSGVTASKWSAPQLSLSQNNWNFLPPYSTSDNPHYYQGLVNSSFGELDFASGGTDLALFTQLERTAGSWLFRSGLRAQKYNYLQNSTDILGRLAVAHRFNGNLTTQISLGSYAESPVSSLLDPYQVLVRQNLKSLRSVTTNIAKVSLALKSKNGSRFDFGLFGKSINNLPTLTPTFASENSEPVALGMRSNGSQRFYGLTAAYAKPAALSGVFGNRLNLRTSYAFTHSAATTAGHHTNYSEDSPHRFELDATYQASSSIRVGGLFTMRSGNRFTAPFALGAQTTGNQSAQNGGTFYASQLALENSSRFTAHMNVNLSISYQTGSWTTMANVGNALNRANPIVSAHDGFVYDASILPSVGATYSF